MRNSSTQHWIAICLGAKWLLNGRAVCVGKALPLWLLCLIRSRKKTPQLSPKARQIQAQPGVGLDEQESSRRTNFDSLFQVKVSYFLELSIKPAILRLKSMWITPTRLCVWRIFEVFLLLISARFGSFMMKSRSSWLYRVEALKINSAIEVSEGAVCGASDGKINLEQSAANQLSLCSLPCACEYS